MRVLGLDYGSKTIGVAVSDPFLSTALGLETIRRPDEGAIKKSVSRLKEIISEYDINKIVIGYPKHLNNEESERCAKTAEFGERLKRNFKNIEIIYFDERLSSVFAEKELASAGVKKAKIGEIIDMTAAVVILQNYLDCSAANNKT